MKQGTLVKAVWDDHAIHGEWPPLPTALVRYTSVGFFVEQNDEWVAVALSRQEQSGEFGDVQVIDRRTLVKLQAIRGAKI